MEDIDTLQTEIEVSKGRGNIIICMVNTPLLGDTLIETLSRRFLLRIIRVKDGEHIVGILRGEREDSVTPRYEAWVWIMPEKESRDILNALNIYRELFYNTNAPNLIFCNRGFLNAIIRETPDFWRYRGNYYEFEAEEELRIPFSSKAFEFPLIYQDKEDLLRKRRIIEYLLDKTEEKKEKGDLYREKAVIHHILGEIGEALECSERALEIHREIGDRQGEARALGNIGVIYANKGDLDEALKYLKEALKIDREIGYRQGEASQLGNIGLILKSIGRKNDALKSLKEAQEIFDRIGAKTLANTVNRYIREMISED